MKKSLHLFLLVLTTLMLTTGAALGQSVISGTVIDSDKEIVTGANVLLRIKGDQSVVAFSMTDNTGAYKITYSGSADSLTLHVTGFNLKNQEKNIANRTQRVDFVVTPEQIQINEVIVRARAITRRSDTLTYRVSSFIDSTDRSIGDVLKKMPGIEVSESGGITYNGKAINKFYIEGADMLGGRYGTATNNVSARDIASVQVYENHQPIKALQNTQSSDNAAINLRLKESVRGTFIANAEVGVGYKPAQWEGGLVAMMFSRNYQMLSTYKTNNSGNDVSIEQDSQYNEEGGSVGSLLGIYRPSTPPINRRRYLENNIHAGSLNNLVKFSDNLHLSINANYTNDWQTLNGTSTTTHHLPSENITIQEDVFVRRMINQGSLGIKLLSNQENSYINNTTSISGSWGNDFGRVLAGDKTISQNLTGDSYDLTNLLWFVKNINDFTVHFHSIIKYSNLPQTLTVEPLLYPSIFEVTESQYPGSEQWLNLKKFSAQNYVSLGYKFGRNTFSARVGAYVLCDRMESRLNPMGIDLGVDSLKNDIKFNNINTYVMPTYTYNIYRKFDLSAGLSIVNKNIRIEDTENRSVNRFVVDPYISTSITISPMLKVNASGNLSNDVGGIFDSYSGYIMSDYRTISSLSGILSENIYQNYKAEMSYGNAIYSLFGSLSASYWNMQSNVMYNNEYGELLSQIRAYQINNTSQGYRLWGKISKRFETYPYPFTVQVDGGYFKSYRNVLRQNELINATSQTLSAGLLLNLRIAKLANLSYDARWSRSTTVVESNSEELDPLTTFRQFTTLNLNVLKSVSININGEGYFNSAVKEGNRSIYFMDIGLNYRKRRFEISLQANNLFNAKTFVTAFYGDITSYYSVYALRTRSAMLTTRFQIL